jgi:phosphatidylserine/phosphatidylglycerophosphate/cardiolipin synthase-like enzyme
MAKFLTTKQISSELEQMIAEADKTLYLISPYLKLSKDFQELINSRNKREKKTTIIYGKVDLTPEQLKFLTGLRHVYLKFHKNLHAKCYLNDTKLIITSMNFYEHSMINNKEMGVLYDNMETEDAEIYKKAFEHIIFIEDNSDDKPFELSTTKTDKVEKINSRNKMDSNLKGYCIRTGKQIPFDIKHPFSKDAYNIWAKHQDKDYKEKFCHFSGEESNGETTFSKPILKKHWKKASELHDL